MPCLARRPLQFAQHLLFGFRRRHFSAILRLAGQCLILRWQDSKWGQTRHRHNDTLPLPRLAPFARRLLHLEVVWFVASSITRQDMSMSYLAHFIWGSWTILWNCLDVESLLASRSMQDKDTWRLSHSPSGIVLMLICSWSLDLSLAQDKNTNWQGFFFHLLNCWNWG